MAASGSEFDLIARYFTRPAPPGTLGVGDDCALFAVDPECVLATSTDLLIEGVHFFSDVDPVGLGHKSLAVNLSDLAAMGARPLGGLLGLALPSVSESWLSALAKGFHALADTSGCPLLGGDTTRSLAGHTISVTVFGQVPVATALRRAAARPGDDIWLTGTLGAPDIALRILQGRLSADPTVLQATRPFLDRPQPPLAFAAELPGKAHAALDISDGLLQDLGHILKASECGARLVYQCLPVHPSLSTLPEPVVRQAVLSGGDVYQLCFTAAPAQAASLLALARRYGVQLTRVGCITPEPGLVIEYNGQIMPWSGPGGFDHFSASATGAVPLPSP